MSVDDLGGDAPAKVDAQRERLENLARIADQQASAHAVMRDEYDRWNFALTLASLIPMASLLCLVLVSDDFANRAMDFSPDHFKLFNAGVALFAFICVLVQLVWKPDSRAAGHGRAVDHYANAKMDARRLLDEAEPLAAERVNLIEDKYLDVRGLPPIPEGRFNKLKQRHLQKVEISRALSKDPWMKVPGPGKRPLE